MKLRTRVMRTIFGMRPRNTAGRFYPAAVTHIRTAGFAVSIFLFLLFILTSSGNAQTGSAVTGVVTDATGALVPGVQVKLTDTKTSRELVTTTNDQGTYVFTKVPQGTGYTLEFSASGFQRYILTDVTLGIGKTETYNAQLVPGDVAA